MKNVLVVRNVAQAALFECELKGQLSDGAWENTAPHDHWKPWADAEVRVAAAARAGCFTELGRSDYEGLGRNFYARKDSYNFARKDLLDVVGGRMLGYARVARALGLEAAKKIDEVGGLWGSDTTPVLGPATNGVDRSAVEAALANEAYGMRELRQDLRDLGKIIKMRVA